MYILSRNQGKNMHQLKGFLLSLIVVSPITVSFSVVSMNKANAQTPSPTLAQCVKELNDAYPYRIEPDVFRKHTQVCLKNLAIQTPTESLGRCVAGMNQIYPYRIEPDVVAVHTEDCNNLLSAQRSNSNRQLQPTPNGNIFVIPGASRTSPQEFANCVNGQMYRQKQVCIDPWGGIDESCFYRGRGGKRTVSEPTGVTIDQARAICGG